MRLRVGAIWAGLVVAAVFAGPRWLAGVFGPTVGVAAVQTARSWRQSSWRQSSWRQTSSRQTSSPARSSPSSDRPVALLAGIGAATLVIGAAFGLGGLLIAAATILAIVGALGLAVRARVRSGSLHHPPSVRATAGVMFVVGGAGAAPVVMRSASSHGSVPALVLCTYALVYDASAYVVGSGASRWWEGPLAGALATAVVTIIVAAVLVPPFRGVTPWLFGAVAAVAAPLGPRVAAVVAGGRRRGGALGRVDSLIVLGPAWSALALAVVH